MRRLPCMSGRALAPGYSAGAARNGSVSAPRGGCAPAKNRGLAPTRSHSGLTLFEVLLALAIFMGSMVVLGQLLSTGVRGALRAKLETEAIFRAESKLGEITAGALPFEAVSSEVETDSEDWRYSVDIEQGPSDQLFVVTVTSTHPGQTSSSDVSFSLSRLVRDPQLLLDAATADAQAADDGASSSSSTTTP